MQINLQSRRTPDSNTEINDEGIYLLSIPAGRKSNYRWAQFDDYLDKSRKKFEWQPPSHLSLEARCDNSHHQGTWGFGFWNDPFNTSLGVKGSARRLPVLPNCAWFFFASEHNYLSFENKLPAQGFLAATFSSPIIPSIFYAPTLPFLPLLINKNFAKFARRILNNFVKQDASLINIDVTNWHTYEIDWQNHEVQFLIDDQLILSTLLSPIGKLGLVIWVDNQFAAFKPDGQISFGTLVAQESTTLEIKNLVIK